MNANSIARFVDIAIKMVDSSGPVILDYFRKNLPFEKKDDQSPVTQADQEVETLLNTDQLPGFHSITWDAGDIPSGFYIIRLNDNANTISKKVLLVK